MAKVNIPGVGIVNFPDTMSREQIASEAKRLSDEARSTAQQAPSVEDQTQIAVRNGELPALPGEQGPARGPSVRASEVAESPLQTAVRQVSPMVRGVVEGGKAVAETGLTVATSLLGQVGGGWRGLANMARGRPAAEGVTDTMESLTYSPKSEAGRRVLSGVAAPLTDLDQKMQDGAFWISGGNPELATIAYSAMNMLPTERALPGAVRTFRSNMIARQAAAATERVLLEQGVQLGSRKMSEQISRAIQDAAGEVPGRRGDAISTLPDDVRTASDIHRDEIDSAYRRARSGNTYVNMRDVENLLQTVDSILSDYNAPNSSFNILDTDNNLKANYEQIRSWAVQQRAARTPGDIAGENVPPTPRQGPGTDIVPAGPVRGSAIPIPMADWNVARQPGPTTNQTRFPTSRTPAIPETATGPRNTLPATQGGREIVPVGPRRTEQTVTGRNSSTGRELPGTNAIVHLNEVDRVRRTLKSMLPENRKNWTPQDRLRMQMKGALDDFIDTQFERGLISGTEADIQAWTRARNLTSEYRQNFEVNKQIYRLATDHDANPEDFRKYIFGLSQNGMKTEAAQVVQKIKSIFGENSPQVNALRTEFLMDALEPLRGDNMDLPKFLKYYDNIKRNNPTLIDELSPFASQGLDELARVARAAVKTGDPSGITISIPKMLARFTVGHQIARKGALVGFSASVLEAVFGRSPAKVRRAMLNELIGIQTDAPLFPPNTAELQGLWGAALNEAFTREFEREEEQE